jgi:predicted nucleic acid-binding protein
LEGQQLKIPPNPPLKKGGILNLMAVTLRLLSGLREQNQFQQLQQMVASFPIILATQSHHLEAANLANICRHAGVTTSATDCLIAAITIERQT